MTLIVYVHLVLCPHNMQINIQCSALINIPMFVLNNVNSLNTYLVWVASFVLFTLTGMHVINQGLEVVQIT